MRITDTVAKRRIWVALYVCFGGILLYAAGNPDSMGGLWFILFNPNSTESHIFSMRGTEGNDSQTRAVYVKKIIAQGPSAIEPLLKAIGQGGTRSRRTWQLNVALKGLGKPAHQKLLAAIDAEKGPKVVAHYVDSLQEAFNDFSRVNRWLDALTAKDGAAYTERNLREQLMNKYQDTIPMILTEDNRHIDPFFVEWYQHRTAPKGALPRWKP